MYIKIYWVQNVCKKQICGDNKLTRICQGKYIPSAAHSLGLLLSVVTNRENGHLCRDYVPNSEQKSYILTLLKLIILSNIPLKLLGIYSATQNYRIYYLNFWRRKRSTSSFTDRTTKQIWRHNEFPDACGHSDSWTYMLRENLNEFMAKPFVKHFWHNSKR